MIARRIFLFFLLGVLALVVWGGWWTADWLMRRPIPPSGGVYFPGRVVIALPQFFQWDARWAKQRLGSAPTLMEDEGCAVASAAMVLAGYGMDLDPGRLNAFLTTLPGGYTPQGWIYWEKAAEFDPHFTARLLPHYENLPSFALIDWNLFHHNPVIARIHLPNGVTHFVVICGKEGFDYLIRDPGHGGVKGVYPLKEFGSDIEAIRYYRKP